MPDSPMSRSAMSADERAAFDCIIDLLEDQGFPRPDRIRNREAVKHAFIEAHRRGFRIRIDRTEKPIAFQNPRTP